MIDVTDARKGATFELDGHLYTVIDYQHIKIGRGSAQVRLKMRDIRAGHTTERTFQSGDRLNKVQVMQSAAQYLYNDDDFYYFMDQETFEQTPMSAAQLGDALNYLKEGMVAQLSTYEGDAIGIDLPISVELEVAETGPSFKGDTASGGTKPAVLETGITVQVPMFLNTGDIIRVDTRSGTYIERA
ncbi:MAG: elongation factor P [Chloroflexota bacterium]|nr:elongation factor P [Chloroflexota bacterium]